VAVFMARSRTKHPAKETTDGADGATDAEPTGVLHLPSVWWSSGSAHSQARAATTGAPHQLPHQLHTDDLPSPSNHMSHPALRRRVPAGVGQQRGRAPGARPVVCGGGGAAHRAGDEPHGRSLSARLAAPGRPAQGGVGRRQAALRHRVHGASGSDHAEKGESGRIGARGVSGGR
jgi:hypothetical protein